MKTDTFVHFLNTHKDKIFFLTAAPGNSGDILLQKGLVLYLETHNFSVTTNPELADIILMHGGGSIDDVWGTGLEHLTKLLDTYHDKVIVVAPSTVHFAETDFSSLLQKYIQEIHLFAREQFSYSYMHSAKFNQNIFTYLSHDTAFLLEGTGYVQRLRAGCADSYVLDAMRTDRESAIVSVDLDRIPQNFIEWGKFRLIKYQLKKYLARVAPRATNSKSVVLEDISYLPYDEFIFKVQNASEVHTDRLHVGILAALLYKPVYLYDTKHHKVSAVYKQSLHRYTNVIPMFAV